jgi:hypothetical protein
MNKRPKKLVMVENDSVIAGYDTILSEVIDLLESARHCLWGSIDQSSISRSHEEIWSRFFTPKSPKNAANLPDLSTGKDLPDTVGQIAI